MKVIEFIDCVFGNKKYWEQSRATNMLLNAWQHLFHDYWSKASAKERERLLPEEQEALNILHRLANESLDEQCKLV